MLVVQRPIRLPAQDDAFRDPPLDVGGVPEAVKIVKPSNLR